MKLFTLYFLLIFHSLYAQQVVPLSPYLDQYQNVRDFCLSPKTGEAFFTIQSPNQDLSQIVCVKNEEWQKPELLAFCDAYSYLEPFISADGSKLYFASNRPKSDDLQKAGDFDIWYVNRDPSGNGWSAPINAGSAVNTNEDEFYPVITASHNLYFTKDSKSGMGKDDIYQCQWDGTQYQQAVLLDAPLNSAGYEFNAYVAPDESFIIYTRYNAMGGFGSGDLYISRKDKIGSWSIPENMGSVINTPSMEYCSFYDFNSQTLYFTSRRNLLTPQKFKDATAFNDYITKGENGWSKIYQYKIKL